MRLVIMRHNLVLNDYLVRKCMDIITYEAVENKIIEIRDQKVIIDSDVAELYGVETKRINEAVSRNPDKFPDGYLIEVTEVEKQEVVANCDHLITYQSRAGARVPRVPQQRCN